MKDDSIVTKVVTDHERCTGTGKITGTRYDILVSDTTDGMRPIYSDRRRNHRHEGNS